MCIRDRVEKAKYIVSREKESCKIDRHGYARLHPAIGKRLINTCLKEMGLFQDMTAVHLEGADYLLRHGRTGDRIDFPGGYGLRLIYGKGELYRETEKTGDIEFCYPVVLHDNALEIPELNALLKMCIRDRYNTIRGKKLNIFTSNVVRAYVIVFVIGIFLVAAQLTSEKIYAVSYTHLDVYKRQMKPLPNSA